LKKKKQITKEEQVIILAKEYASLLDTSNKLKEGREGLDDGVRDYYRPDMDKNDWYDIQAHLFNQSETFKTAIKIVDDMKKAVFEKMEDLTGSIIRENWEKEEKLDNSPPF